MDKSAIATILEIVSELPKADTGIPTKLLEAAQVEYKQLAKGVAP